MAPVEGVAEVQKLFQSFPMEGYAEIFWEFLG